VRLVLADGGVFVRAVVVGHDSAAVALYPSALAIKRLIAASSKKPMLSAKRRDLFMADAHACRRASRDFSMALTRSGFPIRVAASPSQTLFATAGCGPHFFEAT
jgi:hypothetical protein